MTNIHKFWKRSDIMLFLVMENPSRVALRQCCSAWVADPAPQAIQFASSELVSMFCTGEQKHCLRDLLIKEKSQIIFLNKMALFHCFTIMHMPIWQRDISMSFFWPSRSPTFPLTAWREWQWIWWSCHEDLRGQAWSTTMTTSDEKYWTDPIWNHSWAHVTCPSPRLSSL